MQKSRRHPAAVPLAVAAVAAVIALVAVLAPRLGGSDGADGAGRSDAAASARKSKAGTARDQYGDLAGLARRAGGDPTAMGKKDAPVVMVAYSDFQCPFCGKFARETEPTLIREYVDKGLLRIEWRDFPYLGPESTRAAHAARAAAEQGRFWAFHDALYAHQLPPNSGRLTDAYLAGVAEDVGLDVARFKRDAKGPLAAKLVQHDFNEGMAAGVTGTPAFLVDGRPVMGAQPLGVFEKAIDQALSRRGVDPGSDTPPAG